tara:strand:- start:2000 stop:2257 length:258 start_codon:yes stop_codon:yes gene_type:complete
MKPNKTNAIIGEKSTPIEFTGILSLIGLSIDSVNRYRILTKSPKGLCGIQLKITLKIIDNWIRSKIKWIILNNKKFILIFSQSKY